MGNFGSISAVTAGAQVVAANGGRKALWVKAPAYNSARVFLGMNGQSATSANGMPLGPGEAIFIGTDFPVNSAPTWIDAVFATAESGTQDIRFIEF